MRFCGAHKDKQESCQCSAPRRDDKIVAYQEPALDAGYVSLEVGSQVSCRDALVRKEDVERWEWGVPGLQETERMPLSAYRFANSRATTTFPYNIVIRRQAVIQRA